MTLSSLRIAADWRKLHALHAPFCAKRWLRDHAVVPPLPPLTMNVRRGRSRWRSIAYEGERGKTATHAVRNSTATNQIDVMPGWNARYIRASGCIMLFVIWTEDGQVCTGADQRKIWYLLAGTLSIRSSNLDVLSTFTDCPCRSECIGRCSRDILNELLGWCGS